MSDIPTPDNVPCVTRSAAPQPDQDHPYPQGRIHGWLSVFLWLYIAIGGVGNALSDILLIFEFKSEGYELNGVSTAGLILFLLMQATLAVYTVHSFLKRKPDAVFLAKLYTIVLFVTTLLILPFYSGAEESSAVMLAIVLQAAILSTIGFLYFTYAKQVKEVIPKPSRKVLRRDYYIVWAFIAVPLIVVVTAFVQKVAASIGEEQYEPILQSSLSLNEYTDGRVAFTIPEGMQIEQGYMEDGGGVYYSLSSEEVNMQILSTDDPDASQENYDAAWGATKEGFEIAEGTYDITADGSSTINGNPYFYRTAQFDTDPSTSWSFIILFDEKSGIACMISIIQEGNGRTYDTFALLNSIRFAS